jgi:O-antigen ligase
LVTLWIFLGVALLHSVVAVFQFQNGRDLFLWGMLPEWFIMPRIMREGYGWRGSGFYVCPNHLAGFLAMLIPMLLSYIVWGRARVGVKMWIGWLTAGCAVGLALTGSRGGWVAFGVGIMTLALISVACLLRLRSGRLLLIGASVAVLVLGGVFGGVQLMSQDVSVGGRLSSMVDTENIRLSLWRSAERQAKLSPWVGTGGGSFMYYGRMFRERGVQRDPEYVHNDYLQFRAEYGRVGVGLFALFFGAHLFTGIDGLTRMVGTKLGDKGRTTSNELALVIGALSGLAAITVHSALDFNMHVPVNAWFVAYLFALLAVPSVDPQIARRPTPVIGWCSRVMLPLYGSALLALSGFKLPAEYHVEWARTSVRDGFYEKGAKHAALGLRYDAANPELHYYMGDAHHFQALAASTASPPDSAKAEELKKSALEAYALGLRFYGTDLRLRLRLVRALLGVGQVGDARYIIDQTVQSDPYAAVVYAVKGVVLERMQDYQLAGAYYRYALRLDPNLEIAQVGAKGIEQLRQRLLNDPDGNAVLLGLVGDPAALIGSDDWDAERVRMDGSPEIDLPSR